MEKVDFDEQMTQIFNWVEKYQNLDMTEHIEQTATNTSTIGENDTLFQQYIRRN